MITIKWNSTIGAKNTTTPKTTTTKITLEVDTKTGEILKITEEKPKEQNWRDTLWCGATLGEWADLWENAEHE